MMLTLTGHTPSDPEPEELHAAASQSSPATASRRVIEQRRTCDPLRGTLRRRRRVLAALAIAAVTTLLLAVAVSRPGLWGVQVMADVALIVYVAVLLQLRNAAAGVEMAHKALGG